MSGSSLKLTCKLLLSTEPPTYVFWYHEKRMINYDRERGVEVVLGRYQSDLLIAKAQKTDAGNYTCAPSNAQSASIIVHILNSTLEEKPAAMQHGSKNSSAQAPKSDISVYIIILFFLSTSFLWSRIRNYDFR
ncbi:hypothetical protein RUM44_011479 [Polyplax serrata]|uniref:Ig-like domain-containing protein n=1 Tax=Polyplax serrata TaxID=468196 RepID=A0ABR1AQ81_POLSC